MPKLKIENGDWIVVCDGEKALVLENAGDADYLNLKTREVYEQKNPKTHELGTDAPGRAFASVGTARSSMDQTDWHRQSEQEFLRDLVARLDAAIAAGKMKSLIMIAPPRALGVLRQEYSAQVRGALRTELDKDYVKLPVHEIEQRLAG
jgi:protein required for attachment to host cells